MRIGQIIIDRWGNEGKVVRKLSLEQVHMESGEDMSQFGENDELDLPYLEVEGKVGTFHVCEYECSPKNKTRKK